MLIIKYDFLYDEEQKNELLNKLLNMAIDQCN